MNNEILSKIKDRALVAAVTHDNARIWLLNDGEENPLCEVRRDSPEIRHVRSAQSQHGHASEISEVPYFNELAAVISVASSVVLVGHGVGKANAVNRFVAHLDNHREALRDRIAAIGQANIAAMTGPEIVKAARDMWAHADH